MRPTRSLALGPVVLLVLAMTPASANGADDLPAMVCVGPGGSVSIGIGGCTICLPWGCDGLQPQDATRLIPEDVA